MSVCGPRCSGCAFEHKGSIFVPSSGTPSNGVLLVGDSATEYDIHTTHTDPFGFVVGEPFCGPVDWWMDRQFKRLGVKREDFFLANSIWCKAPRPDLLMRPEKHPDVSAAIEHCRGYLDELIEAHRPKVIVALGEVAMHRITGLTGIDRFHAYTLTSPYGIPVIPAYHPSFIMGGNQKFSGVWCHVIRKALDIAADKISPRRDYELLLDPSIENALDYLRRGVGGPVVCDVETCESPDLSEDETISTTWQIVRISFSVMAGTAISMPWREPYIGLAKATLLKAASVVFWNQAFDVPRLAAAGCHIPGTIVDAMWAWHFLQSDLPKALGQVAPLLLNIDPWKHLSSYEPPKYSALDSAITWDCYDEIQKQLSAEDRLNDFHVQCTNLLPILKHATDTGLLLDTAKQTELIDSKLTKERDDLLVKIQAQVPRTVKPFTIYKRFAPKKIKVGEEWQPDTVTGKGGVLFKPFNPGSPTQKIKLFESLDIPVPHKRGTDSATIESKHLRRYAKKYPVLRDIMDHNERDKIITSYDWPLEPDGRIHPEFGFHPSTWRKSARDPNIQTIPKRSDLAKAFRRLFIAAPGYVLIECDSSAIEAVLVGYFAGSSSYIALAKKGVHKWLAEQFAGRPVSKEEPLYDKVKRIVHLSNYMGTPSRIAEEYPDDFLPDPTAMKKIESRLLTLAAKGYTPAKLDQERFRLMGQAAVQEAAKLQDFYFATDAGKDVRKFQTSIIATAHHDHFLQTPFGQRHYFYDVLNKREGKTILGNDAKRAVAFMPQATASALQTIFIHKLAHDVQGMLRAIIHDSIVLECPAGLAASTALELFSAMTSPIPELGGLTIGAECKVGPNLADMSVLSFVTGEK